MISNAKTEVFAWRLPRAGTCGVPEADTFFAAFDNMCEVLEQSADEIPSDCRARIEAACADFVTMNEKMGISPFCVLNFKEHIDHIIEHELDEFTDEEKEELYGMNLLDYRQLFEQMVSVYREKEIADEIARHRKIEALRLLGKADERPEAAPDMVLGTVPTNWSGGIDGWHRAIERLIGSLMDAFPDTGFPLPLAAAAEHLEDVASGTVFDTSGVYTRQHLTDFLSKRDGVSIAEAEVRVRQWEETGRIRRDDYRDVLNTWEGGNFYDYVDGKEVRAVCDAICLEWNRSLNAGLLKNYPVGPNDGLEI